MLQFVFSLCLAIATAHNGINNESCSLMTDSIKYNDFGNNLDDFPCPGLDAGWECDYSVEWSHRNGDHFFCDVDIISPNISIEEFNSKYLFKLPVLINTTIDDWTDPSFWSKNSLIKKYGNYLFEADRSLNLVLNAGVGQYQITLDDYLNDRMSLNLDFNEYKQNTTDPYQNEFKEPLYIFDRTIWNEENDFIHNHFNGPNYLKNGFQEYGILFIGGTGTGATWHGHGETWATMAYGRKRWFLYPPEITPPGGFWPGYSALDWYKNIYPNLKNTINIDKKYEWNDININNKDKYESSVFKRNGKLINNPTDLDSINNNFLYKPLECIAREGQIIYLPEAWFHSILNLGDVIAAGIQTGEKYTPYEKQLNNVREKIRNANNNDNSQMRQHKPIFTDLEKEIKRNDAIKERINTLEMSPNNAIRYFFLGHDYYDYGEKKKAIEYVKKSLLMDPYYMEAYKTLGKYYKDKARDLEHQYHPYLDENTKEMLIESSHKKAEHLWRIGYMLNHNNPHIRDQLYDVFKQQNREDLLELLYKHKQLPPMKPYYDDEESTQFMETMEHSIQTQDQTDKQTQQTQGINRINIKNEKECQNQDIMIAETMGQTRLDALLNNVNNNNDLSCKSENEIASEIEIIPESTENVLKRKQEETGEIDENEEEINNQVSQMNITII